MLHMLAHNREHPRRLLVSPGLWAAMRDAIGLRAEPEAGAACSTAYDQVFQPKLKELVKYMWHFARRHGALRAASSRFDAECEWVADMVEAHLATAESTGRWLLERREGEGEREEGRRSPTVPDHPPFSSSSPPSMSCFPVEITRPSSSSTTSPSLPLRPRNAQEDLGLGHGWKLNILVIGGTMPVPASQQLQQMQHGVEQLMANLDMAGGSPGLRVHITVDETGGVHRRGRDGASVNENENENENESESESKNRNGNASGHRHGNGQESGSGHERGLQASRWAH